MAITDSSEDHPSRHRYAEKQRSQTGDQATVSAQHRATRNVRVELSDYVRSASGHLHPTLATRRRPLRIAAPSLQASRVEGLDLTIGQALPHPAISLPQSLVDSQRCPGLGSEHGCG